MFGLAQLVASQPKPLIAREREEFRVMRAICGRALLANKRHGLCHRIQTAAAGRRDALWHPILDLAARTLGEDPRTWKTTGGFSAVMASQLSPAGHAQRNALLRWLADYYSAKAREEPTPPLPLLIVTVKAMFLAWKPAPPDEATREAARIELIHYDHGGRDARKLRAVRRYDAWVYAKGPR